MRTPAFCVRIGRSAGLPDVDIDQGYALSRVLELAVEFID